MRTTLYAVFTGHVWEWHISLHIMTDRRYWGEQGPKGVNHNLICFEPALSFGQALDLQYKLNRIGDWKQEATGVVQRAMQSGVFNMLPESVLRRGKWMLVPIEGSMRDVVHAEGFKDNVVECTSGGGRYVSRSLESKRRRGFAAALTDQVRLDLDTRTLEYMFNCLAGRGLLPEEIQSLLQDHGLEEIAARWESYIQFGYLCGRVRWSHGIARDQEPSRGWLWSRWWTSPPRCVRCGSHRLRTTVCYNCQGDCPYCEDCLAMGRVRYCTPLLEVVELDGKYAADVAEDTGIRNLPDEERAAAIEHWGLSPAQRAASLAGIRFLSGSGSGSATGSVQDCFLIWAVTGAGKTEMIFPLIEYELGRQGRVCVATPRKDVVLELRPRVARAFPDHRVVTLYGGSEERWGRGEITIATTHQLLRFRRCFDLVIIDELDAFPFVNNAQLEYAADQARKREGRYIFLSATPPAHLQRAAALGRVSHVKVPVRYHRHPLPVPQYIVMKPLSEWLQRGHIPPPLLLALEQSIHRGAQCFVFVPAIKVVEQVVRALRQAFAQLTVEGTSSVDPERTEKVQAFRDGQIRLLVTTTILERGVTVPKTDVFIIEAGSALFDEAALVQMSGRAGRSKDDPHGKVYFAAPEKSVSQMKAIRQIVKMNRLAARHGYLLK